MSLSPLQQHIFAYYVAHGARELDMTPRSWPHGELLLIIEDKVMMAVQKFCVASSPLCRPAAAALLNFLIERQGFSTTRGPLGDVMHRYQAEKFRALIDELMATDTLVRRAQEAGPGFWNEAFAALVNRP